MSSGTPLGLLQKVYQVAEVAAAKLGVTALAGDLTPQVQKLRASGFWEANVLMSRK